MIGGKSFIVDDEGNEEELPASSTPDLTKQDSKHSMQSSESGFNEDEDSKSEQDSDKTQLLFTRGEDLKSFTDRCTLESTVQKTL